MPGPGGRKRSIRYRARFWDGERKRHYEHDCDDTLFDTPSGKRLLNTGANVSYYRELMRDAPK